MAESSLRMEVFDHIQYAGGSAFAHEGIAATATLNIVQQVSWDKLMPFDNIVVFNGEAQPPSGKYAFCHRLIEYAQGLGVERVFTFAAMATNMHPDQPSRVFGAVTNEESLEELRRLEVELLEQGRISGLNGVLLGAAAEAGISGTCLLGEMPHFFSQLPYPKTSLAVLEVFVELAGITIDLAEFFEQANMTRSGEDAESLLQATDA